MADFFSIPDQVITLPLLVTIITVMLIAVAFIALLSLGIRLKNERKTRKISGKKERALPRIYAFIEGEEEIGEIVSYAQQSRYNIIAYQQVLSELARDLKGSYDQKVKQLMHIDPLYNYNKKKLKSVFKSRKISALNYFRKFDSEVKLDTEKITDLTGHSDIQVAHLAANALMSSTIISDRSDTLEALAKRDDYAGLAFLELLHSFHRPDLDQQKLEQKELLRLLDMDEVADEKKKMLINVMPTFGYHESAGDLHRYLRTTYKENPDSSLIVPLIMVLGLFFYLKSAPRIRVLAVNSNKPEICAACAFALGKFGLEDDRQILIHLLSSEHRLVRYEAARATVNMEKDFWEQLQVLKERGTLSGSHFVFSMINEEKEHRRYR